MLQGVPPYAAVYNMKFPGTYAAYALLMALFGQNLGGIRFGLLLVTAATTILVYFLARRFFEEMGAVAAAAAYAMLSLSLGAMGPYAHAMHFVALMATAGMLLLVRDHPLPAGVFLGLAVLMKQPGVAFALFALVWLLARRRRRDAALLIAGGAAVAIAAAIALAAAGVFGRFWFWTIQYAREYAAAGLLSEGLPLLGKSVTAIFLSAPLLWVLVAAGIVVARRDLFLIGFFVASLVAVLPGFYFREHYFLVTFPAAALLAGAAIDFAARRFGVRAAAAAMIVALLSGVVMQWNRWMRMPVEEVTRSLYGNNPFVEAPAVADYLREHTAPGDRIAILGSEPEIFFYANRKSATGYIYTYPLMERQAFARRMQDEMIAEIESARPRYLVMVSVPSSWLVRPWSDRMILDWVQQRVKRGYVLDGIVDITPNGSVITLGPDARSYQPTTKNLVMLFRRE